MRLLVLVTLLGACAYTGEFPCMTHDMCKRGDELGFCEHTGYCTFTDESCATHRRYSELAPDDIGGKCLDGVVTGSYTVRHLAYDESFAASLSERVPATSEIMFTVALEDGTPASIDYREADGAFSFLNPANGRYQIAIALNGNTTVYQNTVPHLRFSPLDPNRPDGVLVTRPTTLAFQQVPSMVGSTYVASTGIWTTTSLGGTTSNTSFDWRTADGTGPTPALLDAAKHDRLYFLMYTMPMTGAMYQTLSAHAAYSVTQVDGMPTTAAGLLTAAAQDKCVALQRMALADYNRLISAQPTGRNGATQWFAYAMPARDYGIAGATLLAYGSQAPPTDAMPMVRLTNPVPSTSIAVTQTVTVEGNVALPGLAAVTLPAQTTTLIPVDPTDASCSTMATLRATVGIAGKLVVDGTNVDANNTPVTIGQSSPVVVRWSTAVDGPGHLYALALHELTNDGLDGTAITAIPNTVIFSPEPRIVLPRSLFQSGHTYLFALTTQLGRAGVANGDYATLEYPFETASTWSHSFAIR